VALAIIISGNDGVEEGLLFHNFLRDWCGIPTGKILSICTLSPSVFREELRQHLRKIERNEPLIIVYFGHGVKYRKSKEKDGWLVSPTFVFPYLELLDLLSNSLVVKVPTLIINSCCYSGRLIDLLKDQKFPEYRFCVIAASGSEEQARSIMLMDNVTNSWLDRRLALSTPVAFLNGGEERLREIYKKPIRTFARFLLKKIRVLKKGSADSEVVVIREELAPDALSDSDDFALREIYHPERWGAALDPLFWPKT